MLIASQEPLFFDLASADSFLRVVGRLLVAAFLGGLIGIQREEEHKAAGLRTHMLVGLGAALYVLAPLEAGVAIDHMSRVMQGLVTAIGFLGAGVIFKQEQGRQIHGLTTAADLWVTAAVGMSVGMGWLWPAVLAVALTWGILVGVRWLEPYLPGSRKNDGDDGSAGRAD